MKKYILLFLMIWAMTSSDDSHRWYLKRTIPCAYDIYSLDQEKLDKAEIQIYLNILLSNNNINMNSKQKERIAEII